MTARLAKTEHLKELANFIVSKQVGYCMHSVTVVVRLLSYCLQISGLRRVRGYEKHLFCQNLSFDHCELLR